MTPSNDRDPLATMPPSWITRRNVLQAIGLGATAITVGSAVPACTAEPPQAKNVDSADLGGANVFLDLDPHIATTVGTIALNNLFLYEGLYTRDPHTNDGYDPELATGPLEKIDDVTYRCTLREGAKFHDGTPVTAEDVAFSVDRMRNPDTKSLLTSFFEPIETVTAIDERTVEFKLNYPTTVLLDRIALVKIMSKAYVTATDKKVLGLKPVGSGPYRVTNAVSNDRVEMEAFPAYNGPRKTPIKKATYRVVLDANARVTALASARVQAIDEVPYSSIDKLRKGNDVTAEAVSACGYSNFLFNCGKAPFNDKRVRQAVLYAIDRDTIAETAFFGEAASANSILCESSPGSKEPRHVYSYNPDKARALLAAAGIPKGTKLEMLIANDEYIHSQGPIVMQNLKDVGLDITLKPGERQANFKYVTDGSYSLYLTSGDVSIFTSDPVVQFSVLYKGSLPKTLMYWDNTASEQVAQLLSEADRATSDTQRNAIVNKVQDILSDEVPLWPIHHRKQPSGWRKTLSGFKPLPNAGFDLTGVTVSA